MKMGKPVTAAETVQDLPPMRGPWGLLVGGLILVAAIASVFWFHHRQAPAVGGPFELIDARSGRQVSDRDFRGKWLLIFFGYTHCPDVCPTTLSNITEAMSQLGADADRIRWDDGRP